MDIKELLTKVREHPLYPEVQAVVPSNHSLRQLVRRWPRLVVTKDAVLKLPEQLTEEELKHYKEFTQTGSRGYASGGPGNPSWCPIDTVRGEAHRAATTADAESAAGDPPGAAQRLIVGVPETEVQFGSF